MSIKYFCDSCRNEVTANERIVAVVQNIRLDKKYQYHFCKSCYAKFVEPALTGKTLLESQKADEKNTEVENASTSQEPIVEVVKEPAKPKEKKPSKQETKEPTVEAEKEPTTDVVATPEEPATQEPKEPTYKEISENPPEAPKEESKEENKDTLHTDIPEQDTTLTNVPEQEESKAEEPAVQEKLPVDGGAIDTNQVNDTELDESIPKPKTRQKKQKKEVTFETPQGRDGSKYFNEKTCYDVHRLILIGAKAMPLARLTGIPYQTMRNYVMKFDKIAVHYFQHTNPISELKRICKEFERKLPTVRALMATCTWSTKDIADEVHMTEKDVIIYYEDLVWFELNFFNKDHISDDIETAE